MGCIPAVHTAVATGLSHVEQAFAAEAAAQGRPLLTEAEAVAVLNRLGLRVTDAARPRLARELAVARSAEAERRSSRGPGDVEDASISLNAFREVWHAMQDQPVAGRSTTAGVSLVAEGSTTVSAGLRRLGRLRAPGGDAVSCWTQVIAIDRALWTELGPWLEVRPEARPPPPRCTTQLTGSLCTRSRQTELRTARATAYRRFEPFRTWREEWVAELAQHGHFERVPAGTVLAREGHATNRIMLVLHGSAQVSRRLPLHLAGAAVGDMTGMTRPLFAVLKERELPEAEFVGP